MAIQQIVASEILLPSCPCGGNAELVDNRVMWFVKCLRCGVEEVYALRLYGESRNYLKKLYSTLDGWPNRETVEKEIAKEKQKVDENKLSHLSYR